MVRSSRALLLHIYMANNNFRDVSTTSTTVRPGLLYRSGNVLNGKLPIGCTPRRILDLRSEEEHESDEAWQAAVAPGGAISFRTYSSAAGTFSERDRGQPVNASELFVVHRVSLLDKGAFVRRLVWQLPLLKMLQAMAYKLVGSDEGIREVLIPVVNDLVRGGTRQSSKLAMGVPVTRSLVLSPGAGSRLHDHAGNESAGDTRMPRTVFGLLERGVVLWCCGVVVLWCCGAVRRRYRIAWRPSSSRSAVTYSLVLPQEESLVVMCALGKDRTGLFVALVLAICQVSVDDILDDYVLSDGLGEVALAGVERMETLRGLNRDMFSGAPRDAMLDAFDFLEETYGGTPAYLERIGFGEQQQSELRRRMTTTT